MKLQGEYNFQDFIDLHFSKYYFNSKQNMANRILLIAAVSALVLEGFIFVFFNDFYTSFNMYEDTKFLMLLTFLLLVLYFSEPKFIYENYKKHRHPDSYIELNEKELKLFARKEIKINMNKLKNTVSMKNGYFLDFGKTFLLYIPNRFFNTTDDLTSFRNLCECTKIQSEKQQ